MAAAAAQQRRWGGDGGSVTSSPSGAVTEHRQRNRLRRRRRHRRHARRHRRHQVTEEVVDGVAGPESPVGETVDKVGDTVGGVLGGNALVRNRPLSPSQCRPMAERGQAGLWLTRSRARRSTRPGSRVNERGHLEIAGCDVGRAGRRVRHSGLRLRRGRHARPRPRLPRGLRASAPTTSRSSTPARPSPAPPPTASSPKRASPSTSPRAASCTWRCAPASTRPGSTCTATTRPTRRSCCAARAGVGHLILDSFDEIERCERLLDAPQEVLIRVTPGIKPSTHDYITTGQLDSKFGFGLEDGLAARAIERVLASDVLELVGLHAHIGSQIFELEPYTLAIAGARRPRRRLVPGGQRRRRARHRLHRARTSRPRSTPTSRSRSAASPRSSARACGSWSSPAARWSATPASPPTGSARSRRSRASAPTSPSTAACPTTCARCSTAPATRR